MDNTPVFQSIEEKLDWICDLYNADKFLVYICKKGANPDSSKWVRVSNSILTSFMSDLIIITHYKIIKEEKLKDVNFLYKGMTF